MGMNDLFFTKPDEKGIDINDFPFLFAMQLTTGLWGFIFASTWFGMLLLFHPDFFNSFTIPAAVSVLIIFLLMLGVSQLYQVQIFDRDDNDKPTAWWDVYARKRMSILVALFAINCSFLIWLTGGIASPFIPFYVMVFTLTLTKCKIPHPARSLLGGFLFCFAIACIVYLFNPPSIDPKAALAIKQSNLKEITDFGFAMFSMIVPYISTAILQKRDTRKRRTPST